MSPLRTQHLSPSSPLFAPSHLEGLSLSLSASLTYSFFFHPSHCILSATLSGRARVVTRILKFDGSSDAAPCTCASRIPSSNFQRIADGMHWHVENAESSRAHLEICTTSPAFRDPGYKCRDGMCRQVRPETHVVIELRISSKSYLTRAIDKEILKSISRHHG